MWEMGKTDALLPMANAFCPFYFCTMNKCWWWPSGHLTRHSRVKEILKHIPMESRMATIASKIRKCRTTWPRTAWSIPVERKRKISWNRIAGKMNENVNRIDIRTYPHPEIISPWQIQYASVVFLKMWNEEIEQHHPNDIVHANRWNRIWATAKNTVQTGRYERCGIRIQTMIE